MKQLNRFLHESVKKFYILKTAFLKNAMPSSKLQLILEQAEDSLTVREVAELLGVSWWKAFRMLVRYYLWKLQTYPSIDEVLVKVKCPLKLEVKERGIVVRKVKGVFDEDSFE